MNPILNQNAFFVKEHVGFLKAANNYDVLDPANGQTILHCREEKLGFFTKILRFTDYKRMTPFDVEIKTPQGGTRGSSQAGGVLFSLEGKRFQ